jgi:pimeloyl-ACP methyl ester carboxylesterase
MQIVVDGLLIHYELPGLAKGKLILLLHGYGDSSRGFATLHQQLSQDHSVLSLDLPGFGASQPPKEVWDLDNYGDFLRSFFTKLELPQPDTVIGHSNGGALAIRAIATGKLNPKKLVLIASAGIRNNQKFKRFILKIIAKTGNIATVWMPGRYRQALRKRLYGVAGSDQDVVPELKETFRKIVRQDVQKDARQLNVDTLLIYGRNDRAVPLADGKLYNQLIKNSRLEVLDAGHFVHADRPDEVYKLIEGFLA